MNGDKKGLKCPRTDVTCRHWVYENPLGPGSDLKCSIGESNCIYHLQGSGGTPSFGKVEITDKTPGQTISGNSAPDREQIPLPITRKEIQTMIDHRAGQHIKYFHPNKKIAAQRPTIEQEIDENCKDCVSAKTCPAKGLKCNDYVKASMPIEQEIENGLIKSSKGRHTLDILWRDRKTKKPCTSIYLPEEKYARWLAERSVVGTLHDIPVYGVPNLDEIHYCTD